MKSTGFVKNSNNMSVETKNDIKLRCYNKLKARHEDRILLFRCGDWYESHGEDAFVVAKELHITLTVVDGTQLLMAAFPQRNLDIYLPRLIRAGYKVVICEYMENEQNP